MEDDTFDFGVNPSLQDVTDPSMVAEVAGNPIPIGLAEQYKALIAQRQARQKSELDASTQRWNDYQEAIKAQREGPSKLQQIGAALAAFGAPTQHGSNWEALGAANRSLVESNQAAAQAEMQRKKMLSELAYKQAEAIAQQGSAGASGLETLQAQMLKASAPIRMTNGDLVDPNTGQLVYRAEAKEPTTTDAFIAAALKRKQNGTATPLDEKLVASYLDIQRHRSQFAPARPSTAGTGLPPGYEPVS